MALNPVVERVTADIVKRSAATRKRYLELLEENRAQGVDRPKLTCGNLAHATAACGGCKDDIVADKKPNIGIITTYNDMLSAHQPYEHYPRLIRDYAKAAGATAQVASGAPAMCDGVTQGQDGMDLSLFSRDVIAMSTAVGLSHGMYDAVALLGICDKPVPGLLIGALRFGHLPAMIIPSGPMPSGLPNKEKVLTRQLYAEGKIGREELLASEMKSYHAPGTCTFYGTANTNQLLCEVMGLMMPDSAFIVADTELRNAATKAAITRLSEITHFGKDLRPLGKLIDEKAIVNAMVALMATGGSTNLTIHLPAIARAAGIKITWSDFDKLSAAVPLICGVYPNGAGDVNFFHRAGGVPRVVEQLIKGNLLHTDALTVMKDGIHAYTKRAVLGKSGDLEYEDLPSKMAEGNYICPIDEPLRPDGGIRVLQGNLGRAIFKTSALDKERLHIKAPCRIFYTQKDVKEAERRGELDKDIVVVVLFQGAQANGMPELHHLMTPLGIVQDKGYKVALVTDGRMSGASGKVPTALHVYPEAQAGGELAKLRDGDIVHVCAVDGKLTAEVDPEEWAKRKPLTHKNIITGCGRELFAMFRTAAPCAPEDGASAMLTLMDQAMTEGK